MINYLLYALIILAAISLAVLANHVLTLRKQLSELQLAESLIKQQLHDAQQNEDSLKQLICDAQENAQQQREQHLTSQLKVQELTTIKQGLCSNQDEMKQQLHDALQIERQLREQLLESQLTAQKLATINQGLSSSQAEMKQQFKSLAMEELRAKSLDLQQDNKHQLNSILAPLQQRLSLLDKSVTDNRSAGAANRASVETAIRSMMEKADQIGADAIQLAQALKGDSKIQGDWGEMLLEGLLSRSGLVKGEEFETQSVYEGKRPDVIINFPQEQKLIIDSKVSLTAYNRMMNAETREEHDKQLKLHISSIQTHIKELSEKNYPKLVPGSFSYVLLFMPNEAAYIAAMRHDPSLQDIAQKKNILIISPCNLLIAIKLCSFLWQRVKQERNIEKILKDCHGIYEKFAIFTKTFSQIGKKLGDAKDSYDGAYNQLVTGRGNLTRRFEDLRKLGINPIKTPPADILAEMDSKAHEETLIEPTVEHHPADNAA